MTKEGKTNNPEYLELNIGGIQAVSIRRPADPLRPWENADQVILDANGLVGVLDGAGRANPASSIARHQFELEFERKPQSVKHAENGLLRGFSRAMEEVQRAEERENPFALEGFHYMTTATIAQVYKLRGRQLASVLHLGDSRLIGMKKDGSSVRTADQSKVYQELTNQQITPAQALVFQHYIDEIEDPEDLNRYISIFGEDLGIPKDLKEEYGWREGGGLPVRDFVNERKVLGNAIRSPSQHRATSLPDCFTLPLDEFYAVALMTDGYTDNIRTTEILKNLEMLRMPNVTPGDIIMNLDNLAKNSRSPKRNQDDRSMVLLKT